MRSGCLGRPAGGDREGGKVGHQAAPGGLAGLSGLRREVAGTYVLGCRASMAGGKSSPTQAGDAIRSALNATTALVPPKAKALLIAARTLRSAGDIGRDVEVALGVLFAVVRRRRHDAVADRHDAGDQFQRAGSAHAMGVHRLGRGHRQRVGVLAEDAADRLRLDLVIILGAGAMRVEVVDVFGREAGIGEAGRIAAAGPSTVGATMSEASAGHADAGKLGKDRSRRGPSRGRRFRAPPCRRPRRAPGPRDRPRTAGRCRGRPHRSASQPLRMPQASGASVPPASMMSARPSRNLVGGRGEGVVGRSAGRSDAEHRPAQAKDHADLAGGRARHDARHGEDAGARLAPRPAVAR